jgi:hypothetical protein
MMCYYNLGCFNLLIQAKEKRENKYIVGLNETKGDPLRGKGLG